MKFSHKGGEKGGKRLKILGRISKNTRAKRGIGKPLFKRGGCVSFLREIKGFQMSWNRIYGKKNLKRSKKKGL